MTEKKITMKVVNGVRYHPDDAPDGPDAKEATRPKNKARTASNKGA